MTTAATQSVQRTYPSSCTCFDQMYVLSEGPDFLARCVHANSKRNIYIYQGFITHHGNFDRMLPHPFGLSHKQDDLIPSCKCAHLRLCLSPSRPAGTMCRTTDHTYATTARPGTLPDSIRCGWRVERGCLPGSSLLQGSPPSPLLLPACPSAGSVA